MSLEITFASNTFSKIVHSVCSMMILSNNNVTCVTKCLDLF